MTAEDLQPPLNTDEFADYTAAGKFGAISREQLTSLVAAVESSYSTAQTRLAIIEKIALLNEKLLELRYRTDELAREIAGSTSLLVPGYDALLDFGVNALHMHALSSSDPDPTIAFTIVDHVLVGWRLPEAIALDRITDGQTLWQTDEQGTVLTTSRVLHTRQWNVEPIHDLPFNDATKKQKKLGLVRFKGRAPLGENFGPTALRLAYITAPASSALVMGSTSLIPVGMHVQVARKLQGVATMSRFVGWVVDEEDSNSLKPVFVISAKRRGRLVFAWASIASSWDTSRKYPKTAVQSTGAFKTKSFRYSLIAPQSLCAGVPVYAQRWGKKKWVLQSKSFISPARASIRLSPRFASVVTKLYRISQML